MPACHRLPAPIVPNPPPSPMTAPIGGPPPDDDDRWVADGYEAAHQAHLEHLGNVWADYDPDGLTFAEMFPRLRRVAAIVGTPR